MAGIGFRLQKVLQKDTYLDSIKGYFYSALIFAGPWILSIVTLFGLSYFNPETIDIFELTLFRTTIIYIFAFSLIFVGLLYLSLSRYLSDRLFLEEEGSLVPAFNSAAALVVPVQAVTGWIFFSLQEMGPVLCLLSTLIYVTISMIWVVLIFLSALRDYNAIIGSYAAGTAATIVLSLVLGHHYDLVGYFLGYFVGHFLIVMLLASRVFIEFPSKKVFDRPFFTFLRKNMDIVLTGLFYNIAIWIDKIVFWASPRAVQVAPFLRTFPMYDTAVFVAYLTIIPSLALFIVQVETDFYRHYKTFYTRVLQKGTYSSILEAKAGMVESLKRNITLVVVCQGAISLLTITFSPEIARICALKASQIPLFRITVLGAFIHSIVLIAIIVILYFDFRRIALTVAAVFMVTNALFTYITVFMPPPYWGYGYFFSALVTLASAFYLFDYKFKRLEYLTFALQPLGVHREEEVA